ncbi:NADPH-dependent glutamate synthase [Candidatus Woesearchaeota archaeon]|nr:NADPH-dependent glutamate synthase [Candidatus Woesearchaeota archaeon]
MHVTRTQDPKERISNFSEVDLGYADTDAIAEAKRCLQCTNPTCVPGCPVGIDIPGFIRRIAAGDPDGALAVLKETNYLPGTCGRVCPQEDQCEKACILQAKKDPINIGKLEKYAADMGKHSFVKKPPIGRKVAVVGSGPAGLTCASFLAMHGVAVTVLEALHEPGGVLRYGIPEFRMPNAIVEREVEQLTRLGVVFEMNVLVGRTVTLDELRAEYDAVFIGSGAGLPYFLNVPGEEKTGVLTANEFLTRINLMHGYRFPEYDTPIKRAEHAVVIGGGNVAMDAARAARRLGSQVTVAYRRTEAEMPARIEEIRHAKEEGIGFELLAAPIEIIGDTKVSGISCQRMALGDPDASGRRRPVPVEGETFTLPCDQVVIAIGQGCNPVLLKGCDAELGKGGTVAVDRTFMTSIPGVYAGGDAVSGSSTVIMAMHDGREAAKAILARLKNHHSRIANYK